MSKQLGRAMLWKVKVGGVYVTVGGLKSRKFTLNNSTVDVTSQDSVNAGILNQEIEMGVQKFSVDGTVLFDSDATAVAVMEAARLQTAVDSEIIVPNWKTLQCSTLYVTKLEGSGDEQKELSFSITIEASGIINAT
jgi:predicted secreted protein